VDEMDRTCSTYVEVGNGNKILVDNRNLVDLSVDRSIILK